MTTNELARYLGVSVARLVRHVDRGTIPHRRIGGEVGFARRVGFDWMADEGELERLSPEMVIGLQQARNRCLESKWWTRSQRGVLCLHSS